MTRSSLRLTAYLFALLASVPYDALAQDAAPEAPAAEGATPAEGAPAEEGGATKRESIEVEPYTGPPIYLSEGEAPPPPTEVESRVITENFPETQTPRFERRIIRFSDDSIVSDGPHKEFYSSGELYVSGEFDKGKAIGKWVYHHPDGTVAKEVEYQEGRPTGEVKILNADGKLVARREYAGGKRNGVWETYSEDGETKLREETYVDGKASGPFRVWYTNGQLRQESTFVDGKLEGLASEFTRVGEKRAEVNFKAGLKDGPAKIWQPDGKIVEQTYEAGKLVSTK